METRHRIFIAVNLPERTKRNLEGCQKEIGSSFSSLDHEDPIDPIRWIKWHNLHLTLVFIGDVFTQDLAEICQTVEATAKGQGPFAIKFNKICLAPPNKPPRMIWLSGEKNQEMEKIKNSLEKALLGSSSRPLLPHITLGRIRQWQWKQIEPEEMPQIEQEISLPVPVTSIEIMESEAKRGGPQYTILESIKL